MHIKPPNIDRVFKELVRVTRRYLISMEVVVKSGNHPKYIERDIGRYSYDYPAEYRNLGLEVVLNEEMGGHQVIMGKKKEGLEW
jgi:hypothetical protein